MKLSKLALDLNKDDDGVEFDFGEGLRIWIARARNPQHVDAQERYMRPHKFKIQKGVDLPEDLSNKLLGCIVADGLIRHWDGLEDDKGNPIPYDPRKARDFMCDPQFQELRNQIMSIANEAKLFYQEEQEKDKEVLKKS